MAGMFYSLEEVMEKLGKTEAEIKTLVREGKLREFRDGAKQLYKVEDVDALSTAPKEDAAILDDSLQLAIDETGEVSLAPEELDALTKDESNSEFKLDETGELMAEESLDKSGSAEEILLAPEEEPSLEALSQEDTKTPQDSNVEPVTDDTDIFVKPEEKKPVTDDDTKIALGGDSINVLGDSDTEFRISDDTSGETKLVGSTGPKSLDDIGDDKLSVERLDADINLESGGSGSGLLDLSLQADDTSLGAVLDDIYADSPASSPSALEQTPANGGIAMEQEAEQMLDEAESPEETAAKVLIDTPETASLEAAAAPVLVIAEPQADMASNAFGFSLFIPLALLIYTSIVISSAYRPINNLKMLSAIEPIVWYVGAGGGAAVILIVLIGSFMSAGAGKPKKAKEVKVKKEKKPKAKKEKKPKKEKKAKKGKEAPLEEE